MDKKIIVLSATGTPISSVEIAKMQKYGHLMGRRIYSVESEKVDAEEKGENALRIFGVKSVIVKSLNFLTKEDSAQDVPVLIVNDNPDLTFPVEKDPFRTINAIEAERKDFDLTEGYFVDGPAIYAAVRNRNRAALNKVKAQQERLLEFASCIEDAMQAEDNAFQFEKQIEESID